MLTESTVTLPLCGMSECMFLFISTDVKSGFGRCVFGKGNATAMQSVLSETQEVPNRFCYHAHY